MIKDVFERVFDIIVIVMIVKHLQNHRLGALDTRMRTKQKTTEIKKTLGDFLFAGCSYELWNFRFV